MDPALQDIFSNEESLLRALAFVRQSAVPNQEKDSLRDLFLAYAGTAEASERDIIKQQITDKINKQPEWGALSQKPTSEVAGGGSVKENTTQDLIGRTRPVPVFSISKTESPAPKADITPPALEPTSNDVTPPAPASSPQTAPVTPPDAAPIPTKSPVEPTPAQAPIEAVTEPAPTIPPAEINPSTTPKPIAAPAQVAPVETVPTPPITDSSKTRIDAIKRDINSRVGNPVNLTEANPEVGREYMTALLDAMRSSASGDTDLSRLETAYQKALVVIKETGLGEDNNAEPVQSTPVTPTKETTPTTTVAPVREEVAPTPITPTEARTPAPTPSVEPEKEHVPAAPTPIKTEGEDRPTSSTGLYHRPADETDITEEIPQEKSVLSSLADRLLKKSSDATETKTLEEPQVIPPSPPPPASNIRKVAVNKSSVDTKTTADSPAVKESVDDKLKSLQETAVALPEKMAELKSEAAARDEAAKKPITDLNAPEIDQGLRQLLSEWSLFKRSGWLGTGPSGIEHPLYKQLSKLPMASVIAGRFEGVTPEIKRQLSDYMTGWRYEQGVVHEMGETFEHYLRRVIKQVMEKQRRFPAEVKTSSRPIPAAELTGH